VNYVLLYVLQAPLNSYLLMKGNTQISTRYVFLAFLYKHKAK